MDDGKYFRLRAREAFDAACSSVLPAVRQNHLDVAAAYWELARLMDISRDVSRPAVAELPEVDP